MPVLLVESDDPNEYPHRIYVQKKYDALSSCLGYTELPIVFKYVAILYTSVFLDDADPEYDE